MSIVCPWCGAVITGHHTECPACGVLLGRISTPIVSPAPPQHRSHPLLWAILALPLLCFVLLPLILIFSYHQFAAADSDASQVPRYADPARETVWTTGRRAIRARIAASDDDAFRGSAVVVSAGNLLTLCGSVVLPGDGATRYLSLWGDAQDTEIELSDPDFAVLWTRLCGSMAQ